MKRKLIERRILKLIREAGSTFTAASVIDNNVCHFSSINSICPVKRFGSAGLFARLVAALPLHNGQQYA
jgi:hypothetical protein